MAGDLVASLADVEEGVFAAGLEFEADDWGVVSELVFLELVFGGFVWGTSVGELGLNLALFIL